MSQGAISSRAAAVRTGVSLEALTVGWMLIEAAVAIGAGLLARSILLTAFGFDSLIELLSAATLFWRLSAEPRGGDVERIEAAERRAIRVSAVLLVVLCAYVLVASAAGLLLRFEARPSIPGVVVSAAALLFMPLLAWRKRRANEVIGSGALRADIAESVTCAYMAATTLAGLALNALFGLWWAEYVAAFVFLLWLARETREVIEAARAGRGRCECG